MAAVRCALVLVVLLLAAAAAAAARGSSAGGVCLGCDVVVESIREEVVADKQSIEEVVLHYCSRHFGGTWVERVCDVLFGKYGDLVIELLAAGANPDDVCLAIGLCKNATCRLYPKGAASDVAAKESLLMQRVPAALHRSVLLQAPRRASERFDPLDYIKEIVEIVFDKHDPLPLFDLDNDTFATQPTLRGSDWRGRDCDDKDAHVYPGREQSSADPNVDHNCNGIAGVDPASGKAWEDVLCGGTAPRGVAVLGDSAAAHFHIPFMNASAPVPPAAWAELAENEADYPQCSWSVGFENTSACPPSPLASGMTSVYMRLRERNLCNHRDYQSISVNGARSTAMADHVMYALSRNPQTDLPLLLFYSLVGNDVCNPHPGSAHMTQPALFYQMVMETLTHLDSSVLASGSYVVLVGLEDGIIWDYMSQRMHPLGVTYATLWEFTDCYEMNPCWGWLNADEGWRNYTTDLAAQLSGVLKNISLTQTFRNFRVAYIENQFHANLLKWENAGGSPADMFEWVGGGHPSQLAEELNAQALWNILEAEYPEALGATNENNARIVELFGNQGGH